MSQSKGLDITAYHETKQHADSMFAFNIYPCTIPQDFALVPLHWQDSMEIIYVKKGIGIVQVGVDLYRAKDGDVFFVLPGQVHGIRSVYRERMEYENIIFDMEFVGGNYPDRCNQMYLQPLHHREIAIPVSMQRGMDGYEEIEMCLKQAENFCGTCMYGYELGVKASMLQLLTCLISMVKEIHIKTEVKGDSEKLKKVLLYIREEYDKKLSVGKVAAACGYSESHFMRWFKRTVGMGFNEYLIEYRLNQAALELKSSDDTVLMIAGRNGFSNLSNFNRHFKKRFGITPIQYRKELPF